MTTPESLGREPLLLGGYFGDISKTSSFNTPTPHIIGLGWKNVCLSRSVTLFPIDRPDQLTAEGTIYHESVYYPLDGLLVASVTPNLDEQDRVRDPTPHDLTIVEAFTDSVGRRHEEAFVFTAGPLHPDLTSDRSGILSVEPGHPSLRGLQPMDVIIGALLAKRSLYGGQAL